jgi:hypothetical protein
LKLHKKEVRVEEVRVAGVGSGDSGLILGNYQELGTKRAWATIHSGLESSKLDRYCVPPLTIYITVAIWYARNE